MMSLIIAYADVTPAIVSRFVWRSLLNVAPKCVPINDDYYELIITTFDDDGDDDCELMAMDIIETFGGLHND